MLGKDSEQNYTQTLVNYVTDMKYVDIPLEVVEKAKDLLLDFLRVCVLGSVLPWSHSIYLLVKSFKDVPESTIIVYGDKVSCTNAAFTNAVFSHGSEWDDTHDSTFHHPGSIIFPSALALGERQGSSGKEILAAVVAGYEATLRTGLCVQPSCMAERYFHAPAVLGPFGSAVVAGQLLKLNQDQMANAFGIAASYCGGTTQFIEDGTWVKRIHCGKSAQGGIWAALLAKVGITAPHNILEGRMGYCQAYSNKYDLKEIIRQLGNEFRIMDVGIRNFACGTSSHCAVTAAQDLRREYNIDPKRIVDITIGTTKYQKEVMGWKNKVDIVGAQLSNPFGVALALVTGSNEFDSYMKNLKNDDVWNLVDKIKIVQDDEMNQYYPQKYASRVTIKLNDGREVSKAILDPKGSFVNPFSRTESKKRFKQHTIKILKANLCDRIFQIIDSFEEVSDINELLSLLIKK